MRATAGLDGDLLLGLRPAPDVATPAGPAHAQAGRAEAARPARNSDTGDAVDGPGLGRRGRIGAESPASLRFESECLDIPPGVDAERLGRALAAPGSGVLRAKGFVRDLAGQVLELQTVGPRLKLQPARTPLAGEGRVVVLRLRDTPPVQPALLALFTTASQP